MNIKDLTPRPMTMPAPIAVSFGHRIPQPPQAAAQAKPQHIAVRPVTQAGTATTAVALRESVSPPQAQSEFLQPLMGLAYLRNPLSSLSGVFSVMLSIENRTAHVAHEPFLCLPLLGLELTAAEGWGSEEVSSVRRLRRFAPPVGERLQPGASFHCCNILLAYDARDGGVIQYDFGTWHRVADLPDLKLTCVAGAGNFPSERLPLVMPAAALKAFFGSLVASGEIPAQVGAE